MAGIDFSTIADTKLHISAAKPATDDVAGYDALTFTEFGLLTDIGSVEGREYSTATLTTVSDGQEREKMGTFKLPNADFAFAWDPDDAGQVIAKAAHKSRAVVSFMLVDQDTTSIKYFTAQISKFVRDGGGPNDALMGSMTLLRQTDTIDG